MFIETLRFPLVEYTRLSYGTPIRDTHCIEFINRETYRHKVQCQKFSLDPDQTKVFSG